MCRTKYLWKLAESLRPKAKGTEHKFCMLADMVICTEIWVSDSETRNVYMYKIM